jgi:hypothetical protein
VPHRPALQTAPGRHPARAPPPARRNQLRNPPGAPTRLLRSLGAPLGGESSSRAAWPPARHRMWSDPGGALPLLLLLTLSDGHSHEQSPGRGRDAVSRGRGGGQTAARRPPFPGLGAGPEERDGKRKCRHKSLEVSVAPSSGHLRSSHYDYRTFCYFPSGAPVTAGRS